VARRTDGADGLSSLGLTGPPPYRSADFSCSAQLKSPYPQRRRCGLIEAKGPSLVCREQTQGYPQRRRCGLIEAALRSGLRTARRERLDNLFDGDMASIIVWDIETVPDLKGFAAANGHDSRGEDEVRAAMGDKFPKHVYQARPPFSISSRREGTQNRILPI
jgi:hypothetical protein